MKPKFQNTTCLSLAGLAAMSCFVLVGCSTGPQAIDRSQDAATLNAAKTMRQIFDSVHGNWNGLTADEKAQYTKMAGGSDLNARASWAGMKDGPGAAQAIMRGGNSAQKP